MLFANVMESPDFWIGIICGILGTIIVVTICLNNLVKTANTKTEDEQKNIYWWNDGKRPDFNKDYD
jgi:hypothetical protein